MYSNTLSSSTNRKNFRSAFNDRIETTTWILKKASPPHFFHDKFQNWSNNTSDCEAHLFSSLKCENSLTRVFRGDFYVRKKQKTIPGIKIFRHYGCPRTLSINYSTWSPDGFLITSSIIFFMHFSAPFLSIWFTKHAA